MFGKYGKSEVGVAQEVGTRNAEAEIDTVKLMALADDLRN